MKAHRIAAVMLRHTYEVRRNLNRITDLLYWPAVNIVMWGFFTVYLAREKEFHPGVLTFLLGAAILWGVFYSLQRDIAVGFLDEFWSRNLVNLFSTPLSISEYMAGLIAINIVKALIGLSASSLIACLFFAYNIFPVLPALAPFLLNLILFALALGVVVTGLIFRYTTKIQSLAWSIAGLLMPLSCVFYPLSALPVWLRPISWALPTTQSFEGMRQIIAGGGFSLGHFGWGLALNAAYLGFAAVFFPWAFESARSRGLLLKVE